jgi:hypothetical protein
MGIYRRQSGGALGPGDRVTGPQGSPLLWIAVLLSIAACESPVTPPPTANSLLARAYLDQFGAPGEAAFQSPQVLVWSQFGLPMKDVLVRFTVSGGSVEHREVLSDSMGLASPGVWTLSRSEGEDVVTATVKGVEPLRFRSRVRVPIELAHYALQSMGGRTVPFETFGGASTTGGSISFYADGTWLSRVTHRGPNGTPSHGQMQGSYSRDGQTLAGAQFSGRNPWKLDATVSGNRLTALFSDVFESWEEVYVKVRSAGSWP